MSQQELEFDRINRDGPKSSNAGYEGVPHYNDYYANSHGQKLTPQALDRTPSTGQRLALAIVSLVLWMVACFSLIGIGYATQADSFFGLLMFFALLLFTVLIVVINVMFNRKG